MTDLSSFRAWLVSATRAAILVARDRVYQARRQSPEPALRGQRASEAHRPGARRPRRVRPPLRGLAQAPKGRPLPVGDARLPGKPRRPHHEAVATAARRARQPF